MADISGAILHMVLQSGIVCCERGWCDMVRNDGVTWNVVWFGIGVRDVLQCQMWDVVPYSS